MTALIRLGDRSPQVLDVQTRLRALGIDVPDDPGAFGVATREAVRKFQQDRAILVDGIVGPDTWRELVEAGWRLGDRVLYVKHPPLRGDDVATLQSRLNALGFDAGRADGIFGADTAAAIRSFQKEYGVAEDGIFGPATHAALLGLRIDRPGTAAGLREELRHEQRGDGRTGLVVVDPGHGGDDPGAISPDARSEAEICWDLALRVAERLLADGTRVRFTRGEGENPDVSERARRANEIDADLFVSLHLNVGEGPNAEGVSSYFFSGSRAGEMLAEALQSEVAALGFKDCRCHARSYPILKETRMPAVVLETGFITNPSELRRLSEPRTRGAIATAVAGAVRRYLAGALV